jgi:hypothetical protein
MIPLSFRQFSASRVFSGRFRTKETRMAGIRKKGDAYYCTFRFHGKRYYFTVGNVSEAQALAKGAEVDETLDLLDRGRLSIPDGVSLEEFVAPGGKAPVVAVRPETVTARNLFDRYLDTHANGTIEENSLGTAKSHLNQFIKSVGKRFHIQGLTLADLQGHVDRRRKKGVSPVTMKKEITTVRACWNWAVHGGLLKGASAPFVRLNPSRRTRPLARRTRRPARRGRRNPVAGSDSVPRTGAGRTWTSAPGKPPGHARRRSSPETARSRPAPAAP